VPPKKEKTKKPKKPHKPDVVVCTCNPSYMGGIGKRITV
jgi:hypothetical protein